MIEAKDIRAIKMAQRAAGLEDREYRELLRQRFRVVSCKELSPDQVDSVVKEIRGAGARRGGWQARQLGLLAKYQRALGWETARLRAEVQRVTGTFTELSPSLTQTDFDRTMQVVEAALEAQLGESGGDWPAGMEPRYWRSRNVACSTRLLHRLGELWRELRGHLPEVDRGDAYLCGIIAHATGWPNRGCPCESLYGLQTDQVLPAIEALKDRLAHAHPTAPAAETVDGADPFARFQVSDEARQRWAERGQ